MKLLSGFVIGLVKRHPELLAFFSSLLLSFIAIYSNPILGKDSAFYLDIAQQISKEGYFISFDRFNWPGFLILLAGIHNFLGVDLVFIGYFVCSLFMAGTATLLVKMVAKVRPELGFWAFIVFISLPAINGFRDDILREYGFWFFAILSVYLGGKWIESPSRFLVFSIHISIFLSAVFRLEAILLWVVFSCFIFFYHDKYSLKGILNFNALPFILLFFVVCFSFDFIRESSRIKYYSDLINPLSFVGDYLQMSEELTESVFAKYLHDEGLWILGALLLLIILLMFVKGSGLLLVAFWGGSIFDAAKFFWSNFRLLAVAAILYVGILLFFLVDMRFLNSRYTSFLHLLCVPLFSYVLCSFYNAHRFLGKVLLVAILIMSLDNVVSLGAKKYHYVEAGAWISRNIQSDKTLFVSDERIRYYAGLGYSSGRLTLEKIISEGLQNKFDYYAIEADPSSEWLLSWLQRSELKVLASFENSKGDTVLVLGR